MRRITLIGNLTKDAEFLKINNSDAYAFTLVVNEKFKDSNGINVEKAYYYDCIIWDENPKLSEFLKKGTKMYVEGSPEIKVFENKNGDIKSIIKVRVNKFIFLNRPKKS